MSLGDFHVVDTGNGEAPVAHRYITDAGQGAINAGEWVIRDASEPEYVDIAADGAANSATWVGVAATTATHTASADGEVWVYDDPNYVFRGLPTTSSNLADTLLNDQVTLDVTAGAHTVDENDTTNGTLRIVGYDSSAGTIDVKMAADDHISKG